MEGGGEALTEKNMLTAVTLILKPRSHRKSDALPVSLLVSLERNNSVSFVYQI